MIRLDFIEVGIAEVAVCNLHMKETCFVEVRPDALDCLNLCAAKQELLKSQLDSSQDRKTVSVKFPPEKELCIMRQFSKITCSNEILLKSSS